MTETATISSPIRENLISNPATAYGSSLQEFTVLEDQYELLTWLAILDPSDRSHAATD